MFNRFQYDKKQKTVDQLLLLSCPATKNAATLLQNVVPVGTVVAAPSVSDNYAMQAAEHWESTASE